MGARGLTCVILDGVERVAQYGQWDHYPDGQGLTVLNFCRKNLRAKAKREKFAEAVKAVRWLSDEEIQAKWKECGATGEWVTMDEAATFGGKYPELSRDTGAKILDLVLAGKNELSNTIDFIEDSLFCEWAYMVNLDTGMIEVYKGFQKRKHKLGRYANTKGREGYYPCALVAEFPLNKLPSKKAFLAQLNKLGDE